MQPKVPKRRSKGCQKDAKREPRGSQMEPKKDLREPSGTKREPKSNQNASSERSLETVAILVPKKLIPGSEFGPFRAPTSMEKQ